MFEFNRAALWLRGSAAALVRRETEVQNIQNVEIAKGVAVRVEHGERVLAVAERAREDGGGDVLRLKVHIQRMLVRLSRDPCEDVI